MKFCADKIKAGLHHLISLSHHAPYEKLLDFIYKISPYILEQ